MKTLVLTAEENASNIFVVKLGRGPSFLMESQDALRIGRHLRRQNLQRHRAIELRVASANDGGHSARADRLQKLEVSQAPSMQVGLEKIFRTHGLGLSPANDRGCVVGERWVRNKNRRRRAIRIRGRRPLPFLGIGWSGRTLVRLCHVLASAGSVPAPRRNHAVLCRSYPSFL